MLQVDPTAEPEVVEASYRALSKKYHPDRNRNPGADSRMSQINSAYDVLRDPLKRQDYDQLRNSSRFISNPPTTRPAPTPAATASASPSRPTSTSASSGSASNGRPASSTNGASNGRSGPSVSNNNGANGGAYRTSANGKGNGPKVASRPNHSFYAEKGFPWGRWLLVIILLAIAMVGGFFLAKTFLDNPTVSSVIPGLPQSDQTLVAGSTPRSTRAPVATSASSPLATGQLTREQVSSYLNNPELYEGRVNEAILAGDSLQLQIRLSRGGRVVNGLETSSASSSTDELDMLRQSELTAYTLMYSLFGRFPDLKTINLSLSDPGDDKKLVYRARIPRALAYSFSPWRGTMDPKTLKQQDFINAAQEDRLLAHLGGPVDDTVRSRINQPDKDNLEAELATWDLQSNAIKVSLDSNGAIVGYFAVRPDDEKLADYARIFYALYTRFPGLDRIQVQDTVPGTAAKFSRASNRALFNRINPMEWAQQTFDSHARELLDTLPASLTSPSLNPPPNAGGETQINPGDNILVKNWQIVNPGTTVRLPQISSFNTARGQFVLVRVLLKNRQIEPQWPLPNAFFSMADAQGRIYQPDPIATIAYVLDVERKAPPGPVEQNKDLEMKLIFDIPINASGLRLLFQDGELRASLPLTSQQTPTPVPAGPSILAGTPTPLRTPANSPKP